jgi:hypothetical protein
MIGSVGYEVASPIPLDNGIHPVSSTVYSYPKEASPTVDYRPRWADLAPSHRVGISDFV